MAVQNGTRAVNINRLNRFLTKIKEIFAKKAPNGGVKINDQLFVDKGGGGNHLEICSANSEMLITANGTPYNFFINGRQPAGSDRGIPRNIYFCYGSQTAMPRANIHCGEMECTRIKINGTDVTNAILALVNGTNAASEEEADAPAEEPEEEQEE